MPRAWWARALVVFTLVSIGLFFTSFGTSNQKDVSSAITAIPSPRTSASEVDNADGSPVSGRDPAALSQRSLSETASRPGVFTTSVTEPSDGSDDMPDMHDGQVHTSHSH